MDTTAFLRWLQGLMAEKNTSHRKRIIRFQNNQDFRRFVHEWSAMKASVSSLQSVRQMGIIQAISCPIPDDHPHRRFDGRVWVENDQRIQIHTTAQRSLSLEKGIPWGVAQIKAPQAWSTTTGHKVKIGVVDTGVDFSHPDLRGSLARGINLLNRSMLPHDDNGHGTHIAGTIAAANQLQGMIGVAPRSSIHPIKAFDHNGSAYVSDIILAIDWCVRNQMHIINMSFGMKTRSKALLSAVTNATNAGVVIVASSGNDGKRRSIDYPARYPQTISVGATNRLRRIAPFSNRGIYIDIYAPGDKITSAWLKGKYHEMSGTSMATSHVSGAVALLLAKQPDLTPGEVKAILRKSMQPLRGKRSPRQTGELDVAKMLQVLDR
ncbi:S8 family peptidase [Paenibacillus xylaniclasticus]|uniref:S8 family peptidase n=1 Tax=Paenibacillus xylaniclasticus TaxID=588083 RepID=UPI000FD9E12F|nr:MULTISPECIES: S8 family peptidase [Paenibacillus]GFN34016.1 aerolysin [Paenibacillus curdlanolyticus]